MQNGQFGVEQKKHGVDPSVPLSGESFMTPDAYLTPLLSTLEEMIRVQQEILSVLQREKKLIIGGERDELLRSLQEKETLLGHLHRLEQRRQEEIAPLGRQWGGEDPSLTLKQLIQRIPDPFRSRLASCHARLEALTASIQELNQINGLLVGRILEQITTLVDLLRSLSSTVPIYQPNGALQHLPSSGRTISQG